MSFLRLIYNLDFSARKKPVKGCGGCTICNPFWKIKGELYKKLVTMLLVFCMLMPRLVPSQGSNPSFLNKQAAPANARAVCLDKDHNFNIKLHL